ncbi:hypothetical protein SAMN04490244_101447 [Tranquillimonas rosea]|uniref:Lipoprotein n=1 Tax=Tranquillimonas rosea TaxID=641238 RepID=A0A1H9Q2W7_9RHOB|nr:hypothetical protein [Tranquillimonas rosea]SER54801.1 hypothetical protein SAMN04490244_101447 [Tranquillimonas rosea]
MLRMAVFLVLIASLAGCGIRSRVLGTRAEAERALPFSTSLSRGEDQRDFSVTAYRAAGNELAAVRESLRYGGVSYCIKRYGGPDVDWANDPATGDWDVRSDGRNLTVAGRCTFR